MYNEDVIALLGFERTVPVHSYQREGLKNQRIILEQIGDFGIDLVYFNMYENGNSFPAVFLKKVTSFDEQTLQGIADADQEAWNYKKVMFLCVYSESEIRIYNCSEKPVVKMKKHFDSREELKNIELEPYIFSDKKQPEELNKLFSRIAIDTGIVWTLEEKMNPQPRVDKYLVSSLVKYRSATRTTGPC